MVKEYSPKYVKSLIAKAMNNRKKGISVKLGESDCNFDRIEIKYPKTADYLSLNPITDILKKHNFFVAQIIDFYENNKRVVLLCRGYK
jgi:hypothetical protein